MVEAVAESSYWLGIDLGTTNTCFGIWKDGEVQLIQNCDSNDLQTPSVVAFRGQDVLIGVPAKNLLKSSHCSNVIYDAKRLVGRKFEDDNVKEDVKLWPFKVVKTRSGGTKI